MGVVWSWNALPGLLVGIAGPLLGVVVFVARPGRLQNRLLALLLVVEGIGAGSGAGFMYLMDQPRATYAFQQLTWFLLAALPWIYLLFLSTLNSPLARLLARRWLRAGLATIGLLAPLWVLLDPVHFTRAVEPGDRFVWDSVGGAGPQQLLVIMAVVGLFGLAVAVSAYAQARPGTLARKQALAFMAAFGVRDVVWVTVNLWPLVLAPFPGMWVEVPAFASLLFFSLLGYAILKTQIFDIDLKIKFAISKSTVVALFAGLVFVASELVEQLLGVDQFVPAVIAAGVIALAMRPLVRVGERVADRVMPGVDETDEYRTVRKREVYQAAVESALLDGDVTVKERAVLTALTDQLGLSSAEARAIERAARPTSDLV